MQLLDELKEYLRIDGNDEDRSLSTILQSSIFYLENAGVKQPKDYYLTVEGKELFSLHRLAIMMLATHFYENRIAITPSTIKTAQQPIPYGLQSIILQIKWVDPDELSVQQ
ncbi:head-tail connector protein [Lysinibacillus sp. 1 U-2021]|uniref:head-tail connector protein n=1 Tax=Lysinibacillus sp. 1 U-2021 TaxID=3039426 RepID=UPI002480B33D|nr:head-tail connector protein [Lysinibacillus sp. 1 U-2021]WGT38498.1 head-tail connector protein [Lysinibacillus sp. 1 U-2021]